MLLGGRTRGECETSVTHSWHFFHSAALVMTQPCPHGAPCLLFKLQILRRKASAPIVLISSISTSICIREARRGVEWHKCGSAHKCEPRCALILFVTIGLPIMVDRVFGKTSHPDTSNSSKFSA